MAGSSQLQSSIIVNEHMDLEITRFTLNWTINKFSKFRKRSTFLRTNGITMRELGQDGFPGRWRVLLRPCYPKTVEGVEKSYIGAYLSLTNVNLESVGYTNEKSVDAEFLIRASTGKEANVIALMGRADHTFCHKASACGCDNLVFHGDLFGDDKNPGLLKDDLLTITIEVTMYGEPKSVGSPEIITADSSKRYEQFVRCQAEALASNPRLESADFKIHSSDGEIFPTYRVLLMSHSAVFAAMLSHNTTEKRLSRCELKDVDGETVGVLLDYVYGCDTGKVTVSNAEKVLIMADKYEMLDLRAACEGMLARNVTGENAVHYLVLASQRNLAKLKEAAMNAIPKNMGTVMKNGAHQEVLLFDPDLMQTIMEHCSKKMRLNDTS